jgi:type VI secretion system FHA domain protein
MVLTLEVIGEQAERLGAAGRKVFDGIGGTIGRLPDSDWVFRDPYVSGRHALIRYVNGKYFIEDTSTNGVFINSPDKRLSPTQSQQLRHGDVIFIDAYQIRVSIESVDREDPLAQFRRDGAQAMRKSRAARRDEERTANLVTDNVQVGIAESADEEGTQWFGLSEMAQQQLKAPLPAGDARAQPATAALKLPARRTTPAAPSRPEAPIRSSPAHGPDSPLDALLAAAGIEGLAPSRETAETLGKVLRIALGGVMDVLRERERMKDELRLRGTTFKAADNNPLKFSANVDDAFHNLLVKHNPAYLEPPAALDDALSDVRDHQTATLIAMRLAFEAMLAQFDPERLQDEFDRQVKKGSILGAPAKLRYWELYRDKYSQLVKNADAGFRNLFADEFAKAYEEQSDRLRLQRPEKK